MVDLPDASIIFIFLYSFREKLQLQDELCVSASPFGNHSFVALQVVI